MKKIIIMICIVAGAIFMAGYVFLSLGFETKPTEIKTGFNNEKIIKMLEEKYDLRIPDDGVFISGYYDNEFQDSSVHITFKIREEELKDLLIDNWQSLRLSTLEKEQYSNRFSYQKQMYTGLDCSIPYEGYLTIVFTGRYPGNPIK